MSIDYSRRSNASLITRSDVTNVNDQKDLNHHICPKCRRTHCFFFKNYKISFSDCGTNEHDKNNLLFDEYKKLEKEKLFCPKCKKKK